MGRQLSGSDWYGRRELCGRASRGECGRGGGVGLLWVQPFGVCDRYSTVTAALRLHVTHYDGLLLLASQPTGIFTLLVNV